MAKRLALILLAVGCGSSEDDGPRPIPSNEVLCQVFAGHTADNRFMLGGYGSLASDVVAAWGEPTSKGDAWTYEWCIGDCTRKATVTLIFKDETLCYSGGKKLSGQFVTAIKADGLTEPRCWMYSLRSGDDETCDGCLNKGEVGECQ